MGPHACGRHLEIVDQDKGKDSGCQDCNKNDDVTNKTEEDLVPRYWQDGSISVDYEASRRGW